MTLTVRIDPDLRKRLNEMAAALNVDQNSLVVAILEHGLKDLDDGIWRPESERGRDRALPS